ncbi:hypothetical protein EV426DRAFT_609523 [Tirmania nivea]|nr:hypothetical protein EV426DRAFT_609523 [Tirmania nivea]
MYNNTNALNFLLLIFHIYLQAISAYLIQKKASDNKLSSQTLKWYSSPALYTEFDPWNKLYHKSTQATSEQDKLEEQKPGRLEKRVDLKCPWGWYQCQPNGFGGCCIVGSACKWNTTENVMGCWWDCQSRERCGASCCLSIHECVNGECQIVNNSVPDREPTIPYEIPLNTTNYPINSNNNSTNSTGESNVEGDREIPKGGGWDSWKLVEKIGLIIGIVSGIASIAALIVCRRRRKRSKAK